MKNILFTLALFICFSSFGQTADYPEDPNQYLAEVYSGKGYDKAKAFDHFGAISDYTKAIGFYPNYAKAYHNRSISKEGLGDLIGACADAKKAINLGINNSIKWVASNCN